MTPMTGKEHTAVYETIAASVVAEPETPVAPGLDPRVIDLRRFDLRSSTKCVIGQVFGEYEAHVGTALNIEVGDDTSEAEESFGVCFTDETEEDDPAVWSRCEDDWRVAIAARQGGAA